MTSRLLQVDPRRLTFSRTGEVQAGTLSEVVEESDRPRHGVWRVRVENEQRASHRFGQPRGQVRAGRA